MNHLSSMTVRNALLVLLLALPVAARAPEVAVRVPEVVAPAAVPQTPQAELKELFVAVQEAGLYADSKRFADATAEQAPAEILAAYRAQRPATAAALRAFVQSHFTLPAEAAPAPAVAPKASAPLPLAAHIDALWDQLTRQPGAVPAHSSLLPLRWPYVVPGGRFRELYYWDSYFTMLGLEASGRRELLDDMVRNFAALIDTYGHVPNGTRSYYLSRSQPPFFYAMVGLLGGEDPAAAYARYLPQLRREHAFWMRGADGLAAGHARERVVALRDGSILNRYWDDSDLPRDESYREDTALARRSGRNPPQLYRDIRAAAESGWDFSSRWFADSRELATIDTTEIVPVDLNSLLWGLEQAIRAGCERAGDRGCVEEFSRRAQARRQAIDRHLWDAASGAYLDYRWTRGERRPAVTAATLYPLFAGLSSAAQARAVAATGERLLLKAGGLVTTTVDTGQQWDAPNGWAPLQWIAVAGLRHYGIDALAAQVACRWTVNVDAAYRASGKLVEKYDVVAAGRGGGGGEYPLQDGFGWTNGVTRKFIELYPATAGYQKLEQCAAAEPSAPAATGETAPPQPAGVSKPGKIRAHGPDDRTPGGGGR